MYELELCTMLRLMYGPCPHEQLHGDVLGGMCGPDFVYQVACNDDVAPLV